LSDYCILVIDLEQKLLQKEEEQPTYTSICGGNYRTPVLETTNYLDEVSYTIGERKYVENAD